jgi:hypothetical protein
VTDDEVKALGLLSESLETVEQARGHLCAFHQLSGQGDMQLQIGVAALREAGRTGIADRIDRELVGRNVVPARWAYQIVEEYDDGHWSLFRQLEATARDEITGAGSATCTRPK